MEDIQDSGKVWCKGFARPTHSVRVENKIFATGKGEEQAIECWVDGGVLCVDLNEPDRQIRMAKKFPLDLEPTLSGTLFNGFTRTKHADVLIVSPDHERIEEKIISGETYRTGQYDSMDSKAFWDKVWDY
ncbi:MAG: hypothetical protein H8E32_05430 [Nitrospinae bacterium]|nr:hypothetical protein [Nitrospinota bacterium]MBL7019016.1 hypothetical protein [Nitrospinaceae bacterium]